MGRIHLTDRQWAFIHPLLPPLARTGRPRADDRRTIEGIIYVLITGCRWQDLPREYGAPTTVWRRLKHWGEAGGDAGGEGLVFDMRARHPDSQYPILAVNYVTVGWREALHVADSFRELLLLRHELLEGARRVD